MLGLCRHTMVRAITSVRCEKQTKSPMGSAATMMMQQRRHYYGGGNTLGDAIFMGFGICVGGGIGVGFLANMAWNHWKKPSSSFVVPIALEKVVRCSHLKAVLTAAPENTKTTTAWLFPMEGVDVAQVRFDSIDAARQWYNNRMQYVIANTRRATADLERFHNNRQENTAVQGSASDSDVAVVDETT